MSISVHRGSAKKKECGTLELTYGLEQSDQIYHMNCGAKGDTMKFRKYSGNIVLYEVVISGSGRCKIKTHEK